MSVFSGWGERQPHLWHLGAEGLQLGQGHTLTEYWWAPSAEPGRARVFSRPLLRAVASSQESRMWPQAEAPPATPPSVRVPCLAQPALTGPGSHSALQF